MCRRRTLLATMGLLLCCLAAIPAVAQTPPYVVLGGQGAVARAIVPADPAAAVPPCPSIVVNGASQAMNTRAWPDADFPIRVCEYLLPASATSAAINGQALPLPPAALKSIVAFGDTGCRIKTGETSPEEAGESTGEEAGSGDRVQDCLDESKWPFKPMSAIIAKLTPKPDLVIHVGDYLYRESPCPEQDKTKCGGSPSHDKWATWEADFFTPAAPLLQAAPWIVTRGNHEICERAGLGYARLLDPTPVGSQTPPLCLDLIDQYTVSVGGQAFIVLDSSNALDDCECDKKVYAAQFKAMGKPAAGTWLITHKPIWGFTNSKGQLGIRNLTLQGALKSKEWNGAPPAGIELVLSGHIHLWEALSFEDGRSPQFVLGSGSTELARKITEDLVGQKIGGTKVAAAATDHHFGYTIFTPSNEARHWDATYYDKDGKKKIACKIEPAKVTCD
jgi:hypothetical protein